MITPHGENITYNDTMWSVTRSMSALEAAHFT